MKKQNIKTLVLLSFIGLSFFAVLFTACKKECDKNDPNSECYVPPVVVKGYADIIGEIKKNRTLSADTVYLLKGFVYVESGATLTIPAGTIIKGDKESKATLVIERGGKIMAQGTKEKPVVFTSNQPKGQRNYGDWGGIVICGNAIVNVPGGEARIEGGPRSFYGGTNNDDNSGTMTYCRVEFCGIEYQVDNEINGITMGGVGKGTTMHHIQVSYSGDDSYEWFGGNVDCKYLVAFRGWDDEFDTDNGFSGKLQFLVSIRDKNVADKSLSNGFESDNDSQGSNNSPYTSPVFSNVSIFGPIDLTHQPTGGNGDFQAAMHLRRNTKLKVYNSVFAGFPFGLFIENGGRGSAQGNAQNGELVVKNCILAGMGQNFKEDKAEFALSPSFNAEYFNRAGGNNKTFTSVNDLKINSLSLNSINLLPQSGSPLLSGADFTGLSGFEVVNFIGAFGTTDWTSGWCNFDPQNTDY
ncbi:MAG: hypothetical protein FWC10_07640 [Lentimicrobiaceae bacterium]|nr:hypothetical protein [Lentimicrobiaceae bacterium]